MRDICFIDKTFDNTQTLTYHLSILISLDGLYFSVLDIPKGKYMILNGHHFFLKRPRLLLKNVREVIELEEVFSYNYKSIEILYATNKFTLVPQVFYTRGSLDKFLWFNNDQERGYNVIKNLFPKAGCLCIFDIPQNLSDYLAVKFPRSVIRHSLFPLVEFALKKNLSSLQRTQVHLNFFRESFEMVIINGVKLYCANIFRYKNEKDILSFISSQIAIAIELMRYREKLEELVRQRTEELLEEKKIQETLFEISQALYSTANLVNFLETVQQKIGRLMSSLGW